MSPLPADPRNWSFSTTLDAVSVRKELTKAAGSEFAITSLMFLCKNCNSKIDAGARECKSCKKMLLGTAEQLLFIAVKTAHALAKSNEVHGLTTFLLAAYNQPTLLFFVDESAGTSLVTVRVTGTLSALEKLMIFAFWWVVATLVSYAALEASAFHRFYYALIAFCLFCMPFVVCILRKLQDEKLLDCADDIQNELTRSR